MFSFLKKNTPLCLIIASMVFALQTHAAIILNPTDHRSARDTANDGIGNNTIPGSVIGDTNSNQVIRNIIEFDISGFRDEISNAGSINLSYTVTQVAGSLFFSGIDLIKLDSANGSVSPSDFQASGSTVFENFDVSSAQVGDVFTFNVTDRLKSDAADEFITFTAFRLQATGGLTTNNNNSGESFRLAAPGEIGAATLTINAIPEPHTTAFIILLSAFAFGVIHRRRGKSH